MVDLWQQRCTREDALRKRIKLETQQLHRMVTRILKDVEAGKVVDGGTINYLGSVAITLACDVGAHNAIIEGKT